MAAGRTLSGGVRRCGPARRSARSPEGERLSVEPVRGGGDSAGGTHRRAAARLSGGTTASSEFLPEVF
ncbi:hypothetical protein GUJ93_ZPchr0013g34926 [Zizania palustris]|uniref:Uncharacterized protein n=1 Tax=Zizania palustris TaxID=103762 RepID=A0A8J5WV41_ZIZPA|nr:hypothetical protein GUJ93_ZPchr0013g34926 [Zizania palustris]